MTTTLRRDGAPPPTSTLPYGELDASLAQLAATLLDPHQHTPLTALAALADGGAAVPSALQDGYAEGALPAVSAANVPDGGQGQ